MGDDPLVGMPGGSAGPVPRIFLSYRRNDTPGHAGRVHDALVGRFGSENVFMDVDDIAPGRNFRQVLEEALTGCDVLLAFIGPNWLARNRRAGRRRLDDPDDFVRIELEIALRRRIVVVPVLVQNATMPARGQLPPSLASLASIQAFELSDRRWGTDMRSLIGMLDGLDVAAHRAPRARPDPPPVAEPPSPTARAVVPDPEPPRPATAVGTRTVRRAATPPPRRRVPLVVGGALAAVVLVLAGVTILSPYFGGGTGEPGAPLGGATLPAPDGGAEVGVVLPESSASARWEGFDRPLLAAAMQAEGLDADIQDAQGDEQRFATLADGMIARRVKVLVIASISSESGAAVAAKAKAQGIPTIDYDRLNLGGTSDYHVSFDDEKVGALQGRGLADALKDKPGAQVVEIAGAPTDNDAMLLSEGADSVLGPLYRSGALKLVETEAIADWDNQVGGTAFEQILTGNAGQVDGVLAANDGLAGAVIAVLTKYALNGQVPVVGQDATPDGLQAVLRGDQYMTVYKPIRQQADAAAKLAAALARGDTAAADALATGSVDDTRGNRKVKSVLLTPQPITRETVKTVVDDGHVAASEVCVDSLRATCGQLGITVA